MLRKRSGRLSHGESSVRRTPEREVITAAGAGMATVEHEFFR